MDDMIRPHYAMLDDDHNIVLTNNVLKWASWFENALPERIVGRTDVGQLRVSTVFLGINHRFSLNPDDSPLWFETMVFTVVGGLISGDEATDWSRRYETWEQAETGHRQIADMISVATGIEAHDQI